jgi:hypothetical protein
VIPLSVDLNRISESVGQRRVTVRVRFPRIAFLVAWTVSLALPLAAQSTNGSINGRVVDPSNGVIVGADILIIDDETSVQSITKTNGEGMYVLPNLPPGPYRLQVSKVGFKTIIKPDITLNVQDALSINFTLPIGALFETVTVEGGAPMVNTTDGSVSTVIDQNYVANMPLNGRSFQDLILLTPGVVTQTPQNGAISQLGGTGEFSVNGQRAESNYYTVDGVSANMGAAPGSSMIGTAGASGSVPAATALGTTQALVSVDDLQEFRVQSSTYSAEYGRNPGGQFAFETKSGTNQWHGTAYDYVRNGAFDANDWFSDYFGVRQPALRQNDFGGTLGGPVNIPHIYDGKNRTFFFVSYEELRLDQPQAATVNYVPDESLRSTAPAPLNEVLNAFPVANGPDVGNGIAEYIASWSNPKSLNSTSVRMDHAVGDHLRFFFRFSDTPSRSATREGGAFLTPAMYDSLAYTSRTYTMGANSMFTNHLSNEFRLNYSSNRVTDSTVIDAFGGNTPTDMAQLSGLQSGADVSVAIFNGGYQVGISQLMQSAVQRQWNMTDSLAFSRGHHQMRFGVDYRRLTPTATPFNPSVSYDYLSESAVQANNAAFAIAISNDHAYPLYQNFSAFAQDNWKVSERLTLSLGLRWDVNPAPGVTRGLKPYTIAGSSPSTWMLAPEGTPLWRTGWYNLAPRLSAAYIVRSSPGHETVVRGGMGLFYDSGQQLASQGFEGPGFSQLSILPSSAFPLPASEASPSIVNPPVAPYNTVFGFPAHLELPYTLQWNGSIEQGLGKPQVLTISYVASHAARLLKLTELLGSTVGNPNVGAFLLTDNGLTSDYNALQVQFRRRLSGGLTSLASYTWSHCSDYGSQDYLYSYQRGDCDFDVRQNLSAALSYDLPKMAEGGTLGAALRQWGIDGRLSARTAFPVTLSGDPTVDPATGRFYYPGLNSVPGEPVYIYGAQCAAVYNNGLPCPNGRAVNPNAFSVPASGLGNAPRNFVRGFGAWQLDMAIRRDFPIHERLRLQFRAEAFNIFNHPNFGNINPNFGQTTFGQATGTLASTLGILSPLYQMGGPRSLQLALKFVF